MQDPVNELGPEVSVINPNPLPDHSGVIAPNDTCRAYLVVETPNSRGDLVVALIPSIRPGMPYDLATYPPSWIKEI